jgi:PAS domain S-box-containing protein
MVERQSRGGVFADHIVSLLPTLRKNSLVWKVNAVFLVILLTTLATLAYVTNLVYERDSLALARDVSRVNSETILHSINKLMMTRDNAGIRDLIDRLASDNPIYQDIRLVSHGGGVVASRRGSGDAALDSASWPCNVCHWMSDPRDALGITVHDEVAESHDGQRVVSVITPIYNEPSCSSAECHAHQVGSSVLGLLQADFSLARVDGLISQRNYHTVVALLIAILLSTTATWLMMGRLVGRRLATLREGMNRVAGKDFGFRFSDDRRDEIAQLANSYDGMTAELGSTLSELSNTRDYLQGIVESSADIIITVDPTGLIQTFNTGAEEILGYDRAEVIGRRVELLFAEPSERDAAIEQLKDSDHVVNYETHFLTKEGEVRDVILTLSRLRTPDGTSIGTFGISKDVTTEKRFQRELMLKEKLAAVGQAVTGIHHSMKNMLNSLRGGAYMVNTGLAGDDRGLLEEGWAMVQGGISSTIELSSRMLQYVKEWKPEVEETDLGQLMQSIFDVHKLTARREGIELRVETARELPTLICDRRLIHSAVTDLVSNALDACVQKGYGELERPAVVLRTHRTEREQYLAIEVQDNGEGMTEEIKKNIFTPFFSTKKRLGTGLGLTLAATIIRMHGGSHEVQSEPGRGTTVRISLPVSGPARTRGGS